MIALHCGPFECVSAEASYYFTQCVTRVAVPFFSYAMVSLLLPQENLTGGGKNKAVQKTYSDVLYMDNNIFAWLCFIL